MKPAAPPGYGLPHGRIQGRIQKRAGGKTRTFRGGGRSTCSSEQSLGVIFINAPGGALFTAETFVQTKVLAFVLAQILDHLAVIGQCSGSDDFNSAFQLGHRGQACRQGFGKAGAALAASAFRVMVSVPSARSTTSRPRKHPGAASGLPRSVRHGRTCPSPWSSGPPGRASRGCAGWSVRRGWRRA